MCKYVHTNEYTEYIVTKYIQFCETVELFDGISIIFQPSGQHKVGNQLVNLAFSTSKAGELPGLATDFEI